MSTRIPITFICDNCDHCEAVQLCNSTDVASGRKWLAGCGWTYNEGKDYCPKCYPPQPPALEVDIDLVAECNRWIEEKNYQERRANNATAIIERVRHILSSGYGDAMDAYEDLREAVGMPHTPHIATWYCGEPICRGHNSPRE